MTASRAKGWSELLTPLQPLFVSQQFLRFLVVGVLNTAVGYGMFFIALVVMPTTFSALCVSTVAAVLFNFISSGTFVFQSREPWRLVRFFLVYGAVFAFNASGLVLLGWLGVGPRVASILLLPGAVGISYVLNSRFTFRPV